jgi:hypothetical protein
LVTIWIFVCAEPDHERALTNMAFFEGLRKDNADKFVDAESSEADDDEGSSERSVYEATCREGVPLVSVGGWVGGVSWPECKVRLVAPVTYVLEVCCVCTWPEGRVCWVCVWPCVITMFVLPLSPALL